MAGVAIDVQTMSLKWTVWTDGGSRGNPGPAAAAFVLRGSDGELKREAQFLPSATVNEAEYTALINALKFAHDSTEHIHRLRGVLVKAFGSTTIEIPDIEILSDSQIVVRQVSGVYECKVDSLRPFLAEVHEWKDKISGLGADVSLEHIPREENTEADFLCNEIMDLYGAKFKRHTRD